MLTNTIVLALAASAGLVSAHGKIAVVSGDQGGNTTALGIQGGVVPGTGPNSKTETDMTIFKSKDAATDGLGKTKGQGENTLDMMDQVTSMSGSTLPQVSSGGSVSGTMHVVTTDGAGPFSAIVDPSAQGAFSQGTKAEVTTQVPGKDGNTAPGPLKNNLLKRALWKVGLYRRALNVDQDYPFAVQVPAGTTCSGTVGNMQNVCLMKVANPNAAGPFGGVIAFQMASGNSTSPAAAAATGSAATAGIQGGSTAAGASGSESEKRTELVTVRRSAKFMA